MLGPLTFLFLMLIQQIFEVYIGDNATLQVNLPAEATEKCKKAFLDTFNFPKDINQWIFDDVHA